LYIIPRLAPLFLEVPQVFSTSTWLSLMRMHIEYCIINATSQEKWRYVTYTLKLNAANTSRVTDKVGWFTVQARHKR